jgi:hypothetical protein
MSRFSQRLERLEAQQHEQTPAHYTPCLWVSWWVVADDDWDAWVLRQPCRCGVIGCPERRIGLVMPAKAPSPEAWYARYGAQGNPYATEL